MEPATMSDVKELMKDLLKEFRESIKEAAAEAFGNSKPVLEHATTSTASQLLAMDAYDAKVPAPACSSPDQGTSAFDLAPTATTDILSELDVDTTGVAAPTLTTCSTDGQGHDTDEYGSVAVSLIPWSTIHAFTASRDASLTEPCRLFVALELDTKAPTRYSTMCFVDGTNVFTYMFVANVTQSISRQGQVLRPRPWPSFECYRKDVQPMLYRLPLRRLYVELALGIWAKMNCSLDCGGSTLHATSRLVLNALVHWLIGLACRKAGLSIREERTKGTRKLWQQEIAQPCCTSWFCSIACPKSCASNPSNKYRVPVKLSERPIEVLVYILLSLWRPLLPAPAPKLPWLPPGHELAGESYSGKLPSRGGLARQLIICNELSETTPTTAKCEVIQCNLSGSPNSIIVNDLCNLSVMRCLDRGFLRLKKWWLHIQCLQLVNAIFEASWWPEQHIIGSSLQVLVTGSQLQLFSSGAPPIFLFAIFPEASNQLNCQWRVHSCLGITLVQIATNQTGASCCFRGSGQGRFPCAGTTVDPAMSAAGHFAAAMRASTDHVLAGLQGFYVAVWGEGAALPTWKIIGLSAEHQTKATHSGVGSLYAASRQWIIPWLEDIIGLTTTWSPLDENQIPYSYTKFVTTKLFGSNGNKCLNALLNVLQGTDDQLATIMLDWIEPQLAGYRNEITVYGKEIVLLHLGWTCYTAIHQSGYETLYNKQAWELAMDTYLRGHVREEKSVTWLLVVWNILDTASCIIISFTDIGRPSQVIVVLLSSYGEPHPIGYHLPGGTSADSPSLVISKSWHQATTQMQMETEFSMQISVTCSVKPTLLLTQASELLMFTVSFGGGQGMFQGGRHSSVLDRHKELRLPWDPDGTVAAWGQAELQGGRGVSDPFLCIDMGRRMGHHMGLAHLSTTSNTRDYT